ncbi:glycoside hydrolase [candidate division KSB1 bacterium]|nr:glycoside hydrolase [candidate division KSB1 bacterium]
MKHYWQMNNNSHSKIVWQKSLLLLIPVLMIMFASSDLPALERGMKRIVNLNGRWKFEIGDNPRWADPKFDDNSWEEIYVPSSWEDEGFPGYDGFAWYRTSFELDRIEENKTYYLYLGTIDDVDETYFNGHYLGSSGVFPPDFVTAAAIFRRYVIPEEYFNPKGKNEIAVRVYDGLGLGGIKRGSAGIYMYDPKIELDINLSGIWKFKPGDDLSWKNDIDDSDWDKIIVPGYWESQGYPDLAGFAWYRKKITIDRKHKNEHLILLFDKIDDMDQTYVNGQLVGHTGNIPDNPNEIVTNTTDAAELRAYYLPKELLKFDGENQIAVRVFDGPEHGGIKEAPVGIMTRDKYLEWKKRRERGGSLWEVILQELGF